MPTITGVNSRESALIGTVIRATLKPEDLITAFADKLGEIITSTELVSPEATVEDIICHGKLVREARDVLAHAEGNIAGGTVELDPESGGVLNDLADALDQHAPEGMYFGAIEGDGSDFGFWPLSPDVVTVDSRIAVDIMVAVVSAAGVNARIERDIAALAEVSVVWHPAANRAMLAYDEQMQRHAEFSGVLSSRATELRNAYYEALRTGGGGGWMTLQEAEDATLLALQAARKMHDRATAAYRAVMKAPEIDLSIAVAHAFMGRYHTSESQALSDVLRVHTSDPSARVEAFGRITYLNRFHDYLKEVQTFAGSVCIVARHAKMILAGGVTNSV